MRQSQTKETSGPLARFVQWSLLALVALMPFHAFLSVWLGTMVGHRTLIQSWKEVLLLVSTVLALALVIRQPHRLSRLKSPAVLLFAAFIAMALVVTLAARPSAETAAFGIKTDCEFLAAFVIAVIAGSRQLLRPLTIGLLAGAAVVAGFGLLQIFVLPPDFLTHFGYGANTILPYQHLDGRLDTFRFAATLGGPNQLGAYLIVPMAVTLAIMLTLRRWWLALGLVAGAIVLVHTYSRAAWIGAMVALAVVALGRLSRRGRLISLVAAGGVLVIITGLSPFLLKTPVVQRYVFHGYTSFKSGQGSDFEHLVSLGSGTSAVLAAPLGHGLGTAGPAVFHTGSGQIIEDYYLQLGYETGVAGVALFGAGVIYLTLQLWRRRREPLALGLVGALAGISVSALVLPAWTDSTGALIFWILAGAVVGLTPKKEPEHVSPN